MKFYKLSTLAIFCAFLTACNTISVDLNHLLMYLLNLITQKQRKVQTKLSNGGKIGMIHN